MMPAGCLAAWLLLGFLGLLSFWIAPLENFPGAVLDDNVTEDVLPDCSFDGSPGLLSLLCFLVLLSQLARSPRWLSQMALPDGLSGLLSWTALLGCSNGLLCWKALPKGSPGLLSWIALPDCSPGLSLIAFPDYSLGLVSFSWIAFLITPDLIDKKS